MRTTLPKAWSKQPSIRISHLPICLGSHLIPKHHRYTSQNTRELNQGPSPQNRTRNIHYAFDPVDNATAKQLSSPFSFLNPDNIPLSIFQHANCLVPYSLGVPWPTSFPTTLQSKYWVEVEETTRAYTQGLLALRPGKCQAKYIEATIDGAVSLLVNVVPMGNLTRMKALAKLYVFFFLSDDLVDSGNRVTVVPSHAERKEEQGPEYTIYNMLAKEILSEDFVQGKKLLESVLSWISTTQCTPPKAFPTLEDYMAYRAGDVGADSIFRSMEFACDITLSDTDVEAVEHFRSLCEKHFLLTNDLYSYAKEAIAEQEHGVSVLNAVRVVQRLMNTSEDSAKAIVRQVIWDVERQMNEEYERLLQDAPKSQLIYAQGLIVCVAGNMFFSATCARYARVVEGSRLRA
ncbi:isoprenoid synthase domain-containing protein [Aspergillus novoparasiticus]|uniref:Isoprenoid synthase domain-containing protein n=1 Tax=Aspergillus novoparasiticus TaxID=986946 RepID=A0A5N6FA61_9EURO|nr:isoprenoid synthase domain-containing protein [Aspergillus novoparasiticus]